MDADWRSAPQSSLRWRQQPPSPAAAPSQSPPSQDPLPGPAQPRPAWRHRKLLRSLRQGVCCFLLVLVCLDLAAEGYFIGLNWIRPPVTAYMLEGGGEHLDDYVALRYVSRYMIAATLAHEDAQLPTRFNGVNWDQWLSRATSWLTGARDPHGSPIPEQLSKNLLLWPSQDPIRKTVDAVLAEQLVHAISRQRVLELYLNEAQFGPHIYGVCDATWYYFDEAPGYMSWDDAYQLMGVLPGPVHAHRLPHGGIDMNPGTYDGTWTLDLIAGARRYVPQELQADGWLNLVQEMGVTGQAHSEQNGPDSCRTMPADIRKLIASGQ